MNTVTPKLVQSNSEEEFAQFRAAYEAKGCFTSFALSLFVWVPMGWIAGCF